MARPIRRPNPPVSTRGVEERTQEVINKIQSLFSPDTTAAHQNNGHKLKAPSTDSSSTTDSESTAESDMSKYESPPTSSEDSEDDWWSAESLSDTPLEKDVDSRSIPEVIKLVFYRDTYHTRMKYSELCRRHLFNKCELGRNCPGIHTRKRLEILSAYQIPPGARIPVEFVSDTPILPPLPAKASTTALPSSPSNTPDIQSTPKPPGLPPPPSKLLRPPDPTSSTTSLRKPEQRYIQPEPRIVEHEEPSGHCETKVPLVDFEWEPQRNAEDWFSPQLEGEPFSSNWEYNPSVTEWNQLSAPSVPLPPEGKTSHNWEYNPSAADWKRPSAPSSPPPSEGETSFNDYKPSSTEWKSPSGPSQDWNYNPRVEEWKDLPASQDNSPETRRPRPPTLERCRRWLCGNCDRGYTCRYIHGDLDYLPDPEPHPTQSNSLSQPRVPATAWLFTLHDHIKVKVGPGFAVSEIITGFETPWVFVDHIPRPINSNDINTLLSRFGRIMDLKIPMRTNASFQTVKIRFSSYQEAREAASNLNGAYHFDATLSAHLPVHTGGRTATFTNTTVRVNWEAPGKVGYGGYPTMERAREAIAECQNGPLRNSYVWANLHRGIPAVGAVTVKFHNLPNDATEPDMARFAQPTAMMWDRPNYHSIQSVVGFLRKIIEDEELLEFELQPAPYRSGRIVAFAHFSSPSAAKTAASKLNGRSPKVTGLTKVYANHLQTLRYMVTPELFARRADALTEFQDSVRRDYLFAANVVIERPKPTSPLAFVKLSASELKDLGTLKTEFNSVLWGETLRQAGTNIWSHYFCRPAGVVFLRLLEKELKDVTITQDPSKRIFTIFGPRKKRIIVRERILSKISEIQTAGQVHSISLHRVPIGRFLTHHYGQLQRELGSENLFLDLWNSRLGIRGSLADFETVIREVRQLESQQYPGSAALSRQCPICFDKVTIPQHLACGHTYCATCLSNYLLAAVDTRFFPLTCLGKEGRCQEKIPLSLAKRLLTVADFDRLVETTFRAHIDTHPQDFHHCPTPDCLQVYRSAPPGTVLQCPSCLLRICPQCHAEYHDGLGCPDPEGHDALFNQWAETRDVKRCPTCKIQIERAEGCNHVTCTKCQTHICWECMKTFPQGEGIYGHMRTEHGSFGLGYFEF